MTGRIRLLLASARATLSNLSGRNFADKRDVLQIRRELDALRCSLDVDPSLIEKFKQDKDSSEYGSVFDEKTPLVTVCVATYNRGPLLVDRCLKSIIAQDYKNLEIIVVGDCCTDQTGERVAVLGDERVRFVNLPKRGCYPEDPVQRWMVAGTAPMNHALDLANGSFVTHLDDDDEFSPDRIGRLVNFIKQNRADLVWHPFHSQNTRWGWNVNKAEDFAYGRVTTSSIFYHKWFRNIPWDINAYRYHEPGDWNRLRKIWYLGAKLERHPGYLLRHYRERNRNPE